MEPTIHDIAFSTRALYKIQDGNVFDQEERKILESFERKANRDQLQNELVFGDLAWEDIAYLVKKQSLDRGTATIAVAWAEAKWCWSGLLSEKSREIQFAAIDETLDAIMTAAASNTSDSGEVIDIATAALENSCNFENLEEIDVEREMVKPIWNVLISIVFRNEIADQNLDDFPEDMNPVSAEFQDFKLVIVDTHSLLERAKGSCLNHLGSRTAANSLEGIIPHKMINFLKE